MKFKLYGLGGQGIRFLAEKLGLVLSQQDNKYISINADYDTVVRGGKIESELIVEDSPIKSPFVEVADICIILSDESIPVPSATYIVEQSLNPVLPKDARIIKKDTFGISAELGSPMYQNMVALGVVLKFMNVDIEKIDFKSILPQKRFEENTAAIKRGFTS